MFGILWLFSHTLSLSDHILHQSFVLIPQYILHGQLIVEHWLGSFGFSVFRSLSGFNRLVILFPFVAWINENGNNCSENNSQYRHKNAPRTFIESDDGTF